jgi:hypothetical protein
MQEKDIFRGYEVGRWDIGPRIYKIFAAATVLAILPLFAVGQMNLMSTSACESPFVNRVCQVLDTVYTGAKILAKDSGYVEQDYQNAELARKNEILWNEVVEGEPQLEYPIGYFQIANRDEIAALEALNSNDPNAAFLNPTNTIPPAPKPVTPPAPRINPPVARNRRNRNTRKPVYPKRNKNVVDGEIDMDKVFAGVEDDKENKKPEGANTNTETPKTQDPKTVAKNTPEKKENPLDGKTAVTSGNASAVPINRKPLYDLVDLVVKQVDAKEVDLSQQFLVKMSGAIDQNGILVVERSAITESKGDEAMRELAIEAIQKVGVSGFLRYLSAENVKHLEILFGQNESHMIANVYSDLKDTKTARATASALQLAMLLAKRTERPEDEMLLLNSAKVKAEGNLVRITFNLDKPAAQEMIKARLAEYKAKKAKDAEKTSDTGKPSGQLSKPNSDANRGK